MEGDKDIHDEMENLAPGFPRKPLLEVPEGYFEEFPDKVLNEWKFRESKSVKKVHWRTVVTIAATVTALLIGGWLLFPKPTSSNEMADITPEEAYQYVFENIDEFENILEYEATWSEENDIDILKEDIEQFLIEEIEDEEPEEIF